MAAIKLSSKRVQISKANATMVGIMAAASFVVVFSLVASKALLSQQAYQSRVIKQKEKARDQLKANITAAESLVTAYKDFTGAPDNVLGGNPSGTGDRDGDNGKIILDALPSKYDFPAVATSLEKIITDRGYTVKTMTGTDQEVDQENKAESEPQPVDMPFTVTVEGSYASMKDLISAFDHSIRPIHIQTMNISGTASKLETEIHAKTYYQPAKNLNIKTEVVK